MADQDRLRPPRLQDVDTGLAQRGARKTRQYLFSTLLAWLAGLFFLLLVVTSCRRPDVVPSSATQAGETPYLAVVTLTASLAQAVATTPAPPAYPGMPATISLPTGYPVQTPVAPDRDEAFLPVVVAGDELPATPTPSPTPSPTPTPTPTIDFAAVRAQLQAGGQDLAFVKMGFHAGIGGNRVGLGEWMKVLDTAGVPFFLKSADDAGPIHEAQQLARASGLPHVLVFRRTGNEYDTPNYSLPPAQAAAEHWQRHRAAFPPELDPSMVWLETINEVDKNRSVWLAEFALATARLALTDGFRWAAFGWSSGEPEPSDWQSPAMLEFLRLAGANPNRLAIALHEYSYVVDDIAHEYPFKVGRFQQLYQICDQHGIPRPTVLITEWGWTYQQIPSIDRALRDIRWAAGLYAPYPQVKGAAIWYLGGGFGGIAEQGQALISPLRDYNLGNYFVVSLPPERAPINPELYRPEQ